MEKRIVIAGCRNYNNFEEAKVFIEECLKEFKENFTIIIISGCCSGADKIGEKYAEENGFKIERYPAEWQKYGRSAGPKRNRKMAEISDFIICFWDGQSRGTKSMIEYTKTLEKELRVKYITT